MSVLGKLRVVILEDELMVAWYLETAMNDFGYEVVGMFTSGEAALADIRSLQPDFALMDINLGKGIDGIETGRRTRETMPLPILFFSSYADDGTRARIASQVPGALLLNKPAPLFELERAITSIMSPA